ncbi:SUKH-3 domain-containing protein [Streptomyces nanhaiensis]|uniref:SUKH-3 domain-containing protein n=1 Tax=Streptomyces nanhaiensis TaxID=679319 RepID=UPI00399CD737
MRAAPVDLMGAVEPVEERPALRAGGWTPGRDVQDQAMTALLEVLSTVSPASGPHPARWELFPSAERALREFHGLRVPPARAGRDCAATGAVVDPALARHAHRTFGELAGALGLRLFPFGRTDGDSLLAVDEAGRLFAVDHGGWWLLGDSPGAGLEALAHGHAPHRLESRRWRWRIPRGGDGPVAEALRAAMTAVYVLHRHGIRSARTLGVRVTALRGFGAVSFDERFDLHPTSLEENAGLLAREVSGSLENAGTALRGAELAVLVLPPPGTAMPLASVDCRIAVDGSADAAPLALDLAAGPGASVGTAGAAVSAAARAFGAWAAR